MLWNRSLSASTRLPAVSRLAGITVTLGIPWGWRFLCWIDPLVGWCSRSSPLWTCLCHVGLVFRVLTDFLRLLGVSPHRYLAYSCSLSSRHAHIGFFMQTEFSWTLAKATFKCSDPFDRMGFGCLTTIHSPDPVCFSSLLWGPLCLTFWKCFWKTGYERI